MMLFELDGDALNASISGEIYPGIYEEFRAALAGNKPRAVRMDLCSEGGSVIDAFAIYNALRGIDDVTITVTGWAASSATIILMAADHIRICANSYIMIHEPSLFLWEANLTATEARKTAGILETMRDTIADAYAKRTRLPLEELKNMMRNETWLNAEEAVNAGFADEIIEAVNIAAKTKIPEPLQERIMGKKLTAKAEEPKKPCAAEPVQEPAPEPVREPEKDKPEPAPAEPEAEEEEPVVTPEEPDPVEELEREAEELKREVETLRTENEEIKKELTALKNRAARALAGLKVSARSEAATASAMSWADAMKDCNGDYLAARRKHPEAFGRMIRENQ